MSLIRYRLKRNFLKTKEPAPEKSLKQNKQRFVIQEHYASSFHYDFRLEMNDNDDSVVLKSWAIPKNIPLTKGVKRLAVQTEDHPIEYLNFEGEIPEKNYGAGKVVIWDKGIWGLMKGSLKENRLSFNLFGNRIKGRYMMIKIKNLDKDKKNGNCWLIWKKEDELS
jgi:bifunctional non-homologous end joining protein LigD